MDVNKANASIKSVNTGLSSMEQAASKAAHGASAVIDGMTASMVKGAAAGNLIAESIKKALEWAKEWTIEAANHTAQTDKMGMSMVALAKAYGLTEEAAKKSVAAVKKVGFSTEDAIHAVDRLMIADMSLSKAEGAGEGRQGRRRHREHHAGRGSGKDAHGHRIGRVARTPDYGHLRGSQQPGEAHGQDARRE